MAEIGIYISFIGGFVMTFITHVVRDIRANSWFDNNLIRIKSELLRHGYKIIYKAPGSSLMKLVSIKCHTVMEGKEYGGFLKRPHMKALLCRVQKGNILLDNIVDIQKKRGKYRLSNTFTIPY